MSTEHQRYSLAAQAEAIGAYASTHGYDVALTYFDPGESGLTFESRAGLQALLAAALGGERAFDVILVLDVSRWGRFQDIDEAAHYEYLCRVAGVRVIYCGEPFEDDGGPVASILKAMKRIMAAEFSRELSAKAQAARVRQAGLGFYQGGPPAYGVRRVAVDATGRPRAELGPGERKRLADDRVMLQPGPPRELAAIRYIFRRYVRDGRGLQSIARELNARGVRAVHGGDWRAANVSSVLRNELAIGIYRTNTRTQTLKTRARPRPAEEWVRARVFAPIVRPADFRAAQARLGRCRRERLLEPAMLEALRRVLRRHGRLNGRLLNRTPDAPAAQTYLRYFGSLNRAYDLIGYVPPRPKGGVSVRARREHMIEALRQAHVRHGHLTVRIVDADPELPLASTYRKHFGSMARAYALAGLPHERAELLGAARRRSVARGSAAAVPGRAIPRASPFSDEGLLQILRDTYARCGTVSCEVLGDQAGAPCAAVFRRRFGSMARAYVLAGLPEAFLRGTRIRRFVDHVAPAGESMGAKL
jgi:DNA invertase Pin-like site-specific DNA recombinase